MDELAISSNELAFLDECFGMRVVDSETSLANRVFEMVNDDLLKTEERIIENIASVSPAVAEALNGLEKNQTLKLVFSDEIKQKINSGQYHLMKKKDVDGVFKAVVVDSNGKTRAIADLKWEDVAKGVDPGQMANAMQGMAIQQQLQEISMQLEEMSQDMSDILRGQHNDRLALYYSGETIFKEALECNDEIIKKQLIASSIKALTDAASTLKIELISEVASLCKKYDGSKGKFVGIKSDKLIEKMEMINSSFCAIHNSTALKAAIYYQQGEYLALTSVLTDYKTFLEDTLTEERAKLLYLADPKDAVLNGTWNIRQNELPQRIKTVHARLSDPEMFELGIRKEAF